MKEQFVYAECAAWHEHYDEMDFTTKWNNGIFLFIVNYYQHRNEMERFEVKLPKNKW